eukprot:scaffold1350_cov137-Skeletonema_dohrnii-CCMP3373.AAC.10
MVDLQCGQIQGFFCDRALDNLDGGVVGIDHFGGKDLYNPVMLSLMLVECTVPRGSRRDLHTSTVG